VKREKVSDLSDFQSAGSGEREKITHHVSRITHQMYPPLPKHAEIQTFSKSLAGE
jgi:hypothetical protein